MAVLNVHERRVPVPPTKLAPLLEGLSGPHDQLWPSARWPAMVLDRPLGVGARGGHDPVRYVVCGHARGQWVRFRFRAPRGLLGWHEFTVHPTDDGGSVLRHTLTARLTGSARLSWPLFFRWLHDALLEDAMDNAERVVVGAVATPARWNAYVRLLRRTFTLAERIPARTRR